MFNQFLKKRRSIRIYQEKKIEPEKLENLLEAALRSPTGRNSRAWHFVLTEEKTILEKLAATRSHGSGMLKGATAAVIVCADNKKSSTWAEDCSIAAYNIQLAAIDEGLSSCWVQVRNREHNENVGAEEYVRTLLEIPESMRVLCIIALGYPTEEKCGPAKKKLLWPQVHNGKFAQSYMPAAENSAKSSPQ